MLNVLLIGIMTFLGQSTLVYGATQVSQLQAQHRGGQTFLTWAEVVPNSLPETLSVPQLQKLKAQLIQDQGIHYLVYRSPRPISALDSLTPIAKIEPMSGWNADYYGTYPKEHHKAFRYVIAEGREAIDSGSGLYVFPTKEEAQAYYAVTVVVKGKENQTLSSENVLEQPVKETPGSGLPILQRIEKPKEHFKYIEQATLYYYVRWESPPNTNIPGKPFDYVVAIPPNMANPAPVGIHLHAWGGNLHGDYGWWNNAEKGAILLATNQMPHRDWWTGYHEKLNVDQLKSPLDWQNGVVRPFTQRRLLSFLDWVAIHWKVDLPRTFVTGISMGGSGSLMLAIRFSERIAWANSWVGVHIPAKTPQFKESYEHVYGKSEWNVKYEDGTPVWDYFNDVWYLKQYPRKEIGFLTFSNGKNDGAIGWPQSVEFFQALQETKRPHMFVWGQSGHGQRAMMPMAWANHMAGQGRNMPIDIRIDQTLPAFTHSSFDDNPGNGDPEDGEPTGQVNAHLFWLTEDIVDTWERWQMTVGVGPEASTENGTVDVTPRRCQKFRPQPGEKFLWKNESVGNIMMDELVQSGQVMADQWGLVTLEKVKLNKGMNRLTINKAPKS